MGTPTDDFVKHREIGFDELHPDPEQARTASLQLVGVPGILEVEAVSATLLRVRYDVMRITLEQIEGALDEAGFHLDNRLLLRLVRALWYYTEEVQRANHGCPRGSTNCTQKIYITRYQHAAHGCRDRRPEHWRQYL
ncbi:MAG: hypothetical protein MUF57_01265 [Gammaproteobacteria bacterium]|jgi:hypothetical protein|nr:hypothetical protein [Gammaproteobacteria bacterium]